MNLQDWVRLTGELSSIHVEVVELTAATDIRQYETHVTGRQVSTSNNVSFYYTTTKNETNADLADSVSRKDRYIKLEKDAETEEDISHDVKGEIVKLEPDPPTPPAGP